MDLGAWLGKRDQKPWKIPEPKVPTCSSGLRQGASCTPVMLQCDSDVGRPGENCSLSSLKDAVFHEPALLQILLLQAWGPLGHVYFDQLTTNLGVPRSPYPPRFDNLLE